MARAEARAGVPMKILMKWDVVAPVWILLEESVRPEHRPMAIRAPPEQPGEPARQGGGNLRDRAVPSRARRILNQEIVAVVVVKLLERLDQQEIDGHPHRAAPIRVTSEQPRCGFAGFVVNRARYAFDLKLVGMVEVIATQTPHSVIAEELVGIEHALQQPLHTMAPHQCEQAALARARLLP